MKDPTIFKPPFFSETPQKIQAPFGLAQGKLQQEQLRRMFLVAEVDRSRCLSQVAAGTSKHLSGVLNVGRKW